LLLDFPKRSRQVISNEDTIFEFFHLESETPQDKNKKKTQKKKGKKECKSGRRLLKKNHTYIIRNKYNKKM